MKLIWVIILVFTITLSVNCAESFAMKAATFASAYNAWVKQINSRTEGVISYQEVKLWRMARKRFKSLDSEMKREYGK